MTTLQNRLLAGGSALLLAISLASCGGGGEASGDAAPQEEPAAEETVTYSHDANLDPLAINPGWLEGDNTSDLWWPMGDQSADEALYFTHAGNDAGRDVTFVDAAGNEDGIWDLELLDNHLVTKADATDKRQVDITFQDNFTCYDAVTDTTYLRGDRSEAEYQAFLSGLVFVADPADPEDFKVSFFEDGTVEQSQSGKAIEGTWIVETTNVVRCHYKTDTSEWDTEYRFILDADGNVAELDDGAPTHLVLFEG